MKKTISIFVAAIMAFSLTVVPVSAEESPSLYPKVVMALDSDPANLSPSMNQCLSNSKVNWYWNLYETLFDYDDEGNIVPDLASSYEVLEPDCYRVYLFDCIYDSEGNPLTADDVIFSFQDAIDNGDVLKFDIFDHIEKVDDYTLDFYWNTDDFAESMLEFPFCRTEIFTQAAFESNNFATDPVGTGNYVVTEFVPGSKVVLEYDENYWGLNPDVASQRLDLHVGTVQELELDVITEGATAVVGLEQGTVDICTYVQSTMLDEFSEGGALSDKYNVVLNISSDYYILQPNLHSEVLGDDLNLRLAIFNAIDNNAVAEVMGGDCLPMDTFGVSYYNEYNEAWEDDETYINTCDLDAAADYLAASDYDGETLTIMTRSNEACENAATMIQAELLQIGINSEIESYSSTEFDTYTADETAWDLRFTTVGGPNLVGSYNPIFGQGFYIDGFTTGFISDDTLDDLYETAKKTLDEADIVALQEYAMENGYVDYMVSQASAVVAFKAMTEPYYREGMFTPTASTYES